MNIIDLMIKNNVDFKQHGDHHHASLGWISVDCPSCSPGWKKYRLGFELNTGRCNCWSCGRKNAASALASVCGVSVSVAIKAIGDTAVRIDEKPLGAFTPLYGIGDLQLPHRIYLKRRGFDPDVLSKLWGIGGVGLQLRCQWRIYIPIFDKYGRSVSWTTRAIGDQKQRYVSAKSSEEAIPHKEILYGAHLARNSIIVTEGPLDTWAVGAGAVGTFGTSITSSQITEIAKYPLRVICLDSEAQKQAQKLARDLSVFPGVTRNVILETGTDPADADPEEILELRREFL